MFSGTGRNNISIKYIAIEKEKNIWRSNCMILDQRKRNVFVRFYNTKQNSTDSVQS